jgi:hypothetical protein
MAKLCLANELARAANLLAALSKLDSPLGFLNRITESARRK